MFFTNETDVFFDENLSRLRQELLENVKSNTDLSIPIEFWDYVHHLERCVNLHYKPPGGIRLKFHGGLKRWRSIIDDQNLPFYGAKR